MFLRVNLFYKKTLTVVGSLVLVKWEFREVSATTCDLKPSGFDLLGQIWLLHFNEIITFLLVSLQV